MLSTLFNKYRENYMKGITDIQNKKGKNKYISIWNGSKKRNGSIVLYQG